jgi:membrane protein YdbS with pleckstrin-like domain
LAKKAIFISLTILKEPMVTIQEHPLEKRKIVKKSLTTTLVLLILLAILLGVRFWLFNEFPNLGGYNTLLTVVFVLIVLAIFIEPFYEYLYYKKYFYDVGKDFLIIKKGVITPRETILNYAKIQDVYVDQDVFDRIFVLYDVHVSTATEMSGMEAHIDGVNYENAQALRELILSKIKRIGKK